MRIVFDTNTLVSVLLTDGVCRKAYLLALKKWVLLRSEPTFLELQTTLEKPKLQRYFRSENIKTDFIAQFLKASECITTHSCFKLCRDNKDDMWLDLGVDGKADCIVSGDKDLLVLHPFQNIPILNPADFLAWVEKNIV